MLIPEPLRPIYPWPGADTTMIKIKSVITMITSITITIIAIITRVTSLLSLETLTTNEVLPS